MSSSWHDRHLAESQALLAESLALVGKLRGKLRDQDGERTVLLYASAFLQRPNIPEGGNLIRPEDIDGLMLCLKGMNCEQGLTLLLHTPGGSPNAAETIVEYLRSKFQDIEVIIPTYAMSAGTMISLGADHLILGRQSQMGPIDPQMSTRQGRVSAQAIVDDYELARKDLIENDKLIRFWEPILLSGGPGLLQEANKALAYTKEMVSKWLDKWMFADNAAEEGAEQTQGEKVAAHFSDTKRHLGAI